jgi:dGTPase
VSQIGRYLAQKIIEKHDAKNNSYLLSAAFVNIVETACLLHDIGNPPFGHLGEAAIREWFKKNKSPVADLLNYDGNPQGFRLVSFLSGLDQYGLNLTSTLLLSTVKYPWGHLDKPSTERKIGLFSMDQVNYQLACEANGWKAGKKFPFVLLMEAADDIAYSMSDLEDGLEKSIISIDDLMKEFGSELFPTTGAIHPFIFFKTNVINRAVETAANRFTEQLGAILEGSEVKIIERTSEIGELLKKVNSFARLRIYSDESAERVELAGRSVITGLLNHFNALLELSEQDFLALIKEDGVAIKKGELDFHIRLLRRLPKAYRDKYCIDSRGAEGERRAHLIVDFLSGMTDDFALETYQILEGIRIK